MKLFTLIFLLSFSNLIIGQTGSFKLNPKDKKKYRIKNNKIDSTKLYKKEKKAKKPINNKDKKRLALIYTFKNTKFKGKIFEVKDSSICLAQTKRYRDYQNGKFEIRNVNYKDIKDIHLYRRGSLLKGMVIGIISGLAIGYYRGYLRGDDPTDKCGLVDVGCFELTKEQKAIQGAVIGGGIGWGIGTLFGASFKVPINGSYAKFNKRKKTLRRF